MRLSCLPVSYFGAIRSGEMTIGQWARQAADIGFDALDLSILFLQDRSASELVSIRKEIEDEGMTVAVVSTYPDFTHPDAVERERQLRQLEEHIAACAAVGAEIVRVTAGQAHPETGESEGIEWAVDGLRRSVDAAQRHGIRLAYENHSKPGVWQYSDFSHPSGIFLEIADGIADTPIGILFDTANPIAYGEDPVPILEEIIDRVICVHAADTSERGVLRPVVIGTGLVPFEEIFAILKRSGYDGLISIEEASSTGETGVRTAAEFIRRTWAGA